MWIITILISKWISIQTYFIWTKHDMKIYCKCVILIFIRFFRNLVQISDLFFKIIKVRPGYPLTTNFSPNLSFIAGPLRCNHSGHDLYCGGTQMDIAHLPILRNKSGYHILHIWERYKYIQVYFLWPQWCLMWTSANIMHITFLVWKSHVVELSVELCATPQQKCYNNPE